VVEVANVIEVAKVVEVAKVTGVAMAAPRKREERRETTRENIIVGSERSKCLYGIQMM
jgi:hypothetical protein